MIAATMRRIDEKESEHEESITVPQFAKRVHRDRQTAYAWIRSGKMPAGSVVMVQGHLEILWSVYKRSIRPVA